MAITPTGNGEELRPGDKDADPSTRAEKLAQFQLELQHEKLKAKKFWALACHAATTRERNS